MAYTLKFSDPSKITSVIVPDMPPGINTVDTTLSLVGTGYPNYGTKIAENFLHLLENFASSLPPANPIEGQLWYDTSDVNNKILRIMDGTSGAVSWPSANGIYQQASNPIDTNATLKPGDLWVDTTLNQINIYSAGNWIPINSPQKGALNGAITETLSDTTGTSHQVLSNYVDGNRVSILSSSAFTPNPVISGYSNLLSGVNVISGGVVNGVSLSAGSLYISGSNYAATRFLRKDDPSNNGQTITGRLTFSTPTTNNQAGAQGRDGIVINLQGGLSNEYVQFYKLYNDAVLLNNKAGGKILFQTVSATSSVPNNTISITNGVVAINTSTSASSPALDVYGNAKVSGSLTINNTQTSLTLLGSAIAAGNLSVGGTSTFTDDITVTGQIYVNWLDTNGNPKSGPAIIPAAANTYDIGSPTAQFSRVYANAIGTTSTQVYGVFHGPSTGLTYASDFRLQGQVTATNFLFTGGGATCTFVTTLTSSAVTAQPYVSTTTSTLTLMVVDTSTTAVYTGPQKISRDDLFNGLLSPGMIMAHGNNIPPTGWLLCDGTSYPVSVYPSLAKALQYQGIGSFMYGGVVPNFNVPDMTTATPVTKVGGTEPSYVNYIIKT
jgi:hypothetical protein